jgi:hypothetical protein
VLKKALCYLQLLRFKHWVKNALVFIPLFFSMSFLHISPVISTVLGFICFSLLSSIAYIFNDMQDIKKIVCTVQNAAALWLQEKYQYFTQLLWRLFYL